MTQDKLKGVSSRTALKALHRLGFENDHCKGSHQTLKRLRTDGKWAVTVLQLGYSELLAPTLKSVLDLAGVEVDDFLRACGGKLARRVR